MNVVQTYILDCFCHYWKFVPSSRSDTNSIRESFPEIVGNIHKLERVITEYCIYYNVRRTCFPCLTLTLPQLLLRPELSPPRPPSHCQPAPPLGEVEEDHHHHHHHEDNRHTASCVVGHLGRGGGEAGGGRGGGHAGESSTLMKDGEEVTV